MKFNLKRGLDIAINGAATEQIGRTTSADVYKIVPDHYLGVTPKVLVKEGEQVKAGSPLFRDKVHEDMLFVSPVAGTVVGVVRGDRRKVLSIDIEPAEKPDFVQFDTQKDVKSLLLESGLWGFIKQRPYDVVANPAVTPKAVFISSFDSAPLAPNYDFVLKNQLKEVQAGIDALGQLAKVYLGLNDKTPNDIFHTITNAETVAFNGPHPAGNVGVQINHVCPVNKGEVVYTVNIQNVALIGRLMLTGKVDFKKLIAITGPACDEPEYKPYTLGAPVSTLIHAEAGVNIICGNVLSGSQIEKNEPLCPHCGQVSLLQQVAEEDELFGWMMPRFKKFSATRLFFAGLLHKLCPKMEFEWDARTLGSERAIIMSGEYDRVLPMDIYGEYLIKAMITGNLDKMEQLGAYEVAPEDFALAEFCDTSKLPLQQIVRNALNYMRKELE